jgi:hypothetical protein
MRAVASVQKKKKNILNTKVQKPNLALLYGMQRDLRKRTAFLEVSQASSICPGKNNMYMKRSVEH